MPQDISSDICIQQDKIGTLPMTRKLNYFIAILIQFIPFKRLTLDSSLIARTEGTRLITVLSFNDRKDACQISQDIEWHSLRGMKSLQTISD